jgi:O-antigen/teichoic acid export membrane protein
MWRGLLPWWGSLAFLGIMLYLEVIQYFLGRDFREGLGVLPIALIANFFLGLFYNFAIGFKLTDQTRWGGYIALGGAVITIVVNVVFIPSLSYYAPAWATLVCFLFMTTAAYFFNLRRWPVPYAVGRMAYYLALVLGAWGGSLLLAGYLPNGLAYRIAVNTLLLVTTLLVLFKTEWPWLKSVLKG